MDVAAKGDGDALCRPAGLGRFRFAGSLSKSNDAAAGVDLFRGMHTMQQ
jgi:hypothetical protein